MKKIIFTLSLLTLCVPSLSYAHDKESVYERVMKSGKIRCAYVVTGEYLDKDLSSGEVKGAIPDIVNAMARNLELSVEWVAEVGHADFAQGLETGRYDMFCGILAISPSRSRVAAFTDPLFYVPYYAYVRNDEARFSSISDMNNEKIRAGVIDGEIFQKMTRKHLPQSQEISHVNMTPNSQLFVDLETNKIDVFLHDPVLYAKYEKSNPDKVKFAFEKPLELYPIGLAIDPNEQRLKNMLDVSIMALHNLGTIDSILDKYDYGPKTIYRTATPYKEPQ